MNDQNDRDELEAWEYCHRVQHPEWVDGWCLRKIQNEAFQAGLKAERARGSAASDAAKGVHEMDDEIHRLNVRIAELERASEPRGREWWLSCAAGFDRYLTAFDSQDEAKGNRVRDPIHVREVPKSQPTASDGAQTASQNCFNEQDRAKAWAHGQSSSPPSIEPYSVSESRPGVFPMIHIEPNASESYGKTLNHPKLDISEPPATEPWPYKATKPIYKVIVGPSVTTKPSADEPKVDVSTQTGSSIYPSADEAMSSEYRKGLERGRRESAAELARLKDEAPGMCAYCSFEAPKGSKMEVLQKHVLTCKFHPLVKRIAELEKQLNESAEEFEELEAEVLMLTQSSYHPKER